MKASQIDNRQEELFQPRLCGQLNQKNELLVKNEIALRQTLLRKISGYLHAKQMKRARKAIKHLKTIVGRVVRDVERKIGSSANLAEIFTPILNQTKQLLLQERTGKNKIYSLHEPDIACISKGKAHKRYEFGCKVSITATNKQGLVISSDALPGNPYDDILLSQLSNRQKELLA